MAQKRKTDQSQVSAAAALLKKLEEKTTREVKNRLSDQWRDNLFEILMTRMDLVAPDKKAYAAIPAMLRKEPKAIPAFAKQFFRTMRNILKLAKAPASPPHIIGLSVLYASVVDIFIKDNAKDHAKTMAALDQRLGLFERFSDCISCTGRK